MSLKSTIYWTIKRPAMTIATIVFHVAFIITALFLNAHVIIFKSAWGFGWTSLPQGITNVLAILVMICLFVFLLRRLAIKEARQLTTASDFWLLLIVVLPVITGILTHHHTESYNVWLILHIFSGEVMLVTLLLSLGFFITRYVKKKLHFMRNIPGRILMPGLIILCFSIFCFFADRESWAWPFDSMTSLIQYDSPILMPMVIKAHFFIVMIVMSFLLPPTFLRHVSAATLNMVYWPKKQLGNLGAVSTGQTGVETIADFSWKQLLDAEACMSCGKCMENCPALIAGKPLSPKEILQKIFGQIKKDNGKNQACLNQMISGDEIWSCTTCMACTHHCPVCTDPVDKIINLRRHETMGEGALPNEVRPMIRNLELFGDTHGKGAAYKTDWVHDNDVPQLSVSHPQTDVLLWVGCSGAFHPRYTMVMRGMVKILNHAGVEFAILGKKELCCGDQARRLGHEAVFESLAKRNMDELKKYQFNRIVALCPHCLHSLKNEYASLGASFDVIHASELVLSLIDKNKIKPRYPQKNLLTIHDPCYLGRVNKIFKPLRNIGRSIDGIEIKELERSHENGFCCGAGGGQMWLHDSMGRHINHIRAEEIIESGADMVATACPYCLTMLDDGISSAQLQKPVKVVDIIEMVASSIG